MKTYLISYDLRIPETSEDYKILISTIRSIGDWAKPLKSAWFVKTSLTAMQIVELLKSKIDYNDGIFVLDVTNQEWASKGILVEVTGWMKDNI